MSVATTFDVAAARDALRDEGLPFELHLHDACGAQTMELRECDGASEAYNYFFYPPKTFYSCFFVKS